MLFEGPSLDIRGLAGGQQPNIVLSLQGRCQVREAQKSISGTLLWPSGFNASCESHSLTLSPQQLLLPPSGLETSSESSARLLVEDKAKFEGSFFNGFLLREPAACCDVTVGKSYKKFFVRFFVHVPKELTYNFVTGQLIFQKLFKHPKIHRCLKFLAPTSSMAFPPERTYPLAQTRIPCCVLTAEPPHRRSRLQASVHCEKREHPPLSSSTSNSQPHGLISLPF